MRPPSRNPPRPGRRQSFSRTPEAHVLNHREIAALTEDQAFERFSKIVFAKNGGTPYCPKCGCDAHNIIRRNNKDGSYRTIFKCKSCDTQYTPKSLTKLRYMKLPYRDLLYALALFIQFPKGLPAIQLQSFLMRDYGTAKLLARRFREAMHNDLGSVVLSGEVEADNCEIGGYRRPNNARKSQMKNDPDKMKKTGYKLERDTKAKLFVTVVRQRGDHGCVRVGVTKTKGESKEVVARNVGKETILYTDDGGEYSNMGWAVADHRPVTHKENFYTEYADTNRAENYFSMLRRAAFGTYHSISDPDFAESYAVEQAWRVTHNRISNFARYERLLTVLTRPGRSIHTGFYQRRRAA